MNTRHNAIIIKVNTGYYAHFTKTNRLTIAYHLAGAKLFLPNDTEKINTIIKRIEKKGYKPQILNISI